MTSSTLTTAGSPAPELPRVDASGVYRQWGRISYAVVGTYVFLILLVLYLLTTSSFLGKWVAGFIVALFLLFLARYLSTSYSLDDSFLRARRILGGRKVPLEEVRKIEYCSLRDLGPSGGVFGSWGWRGRMWSPQIGHFDAIYTDATKGLLVTEGAVPLYISPVDPEGFARELSRRVRSYTGPLLSDVGDPSAPAGTPPS